VAAVLVKSVVLDCTPSSYSTVTYTDDNGNRRLDRIYAAGKRFAFEIRGDSDSDIDGSNRAVLQFSFTQT
jgi:hypothetical protein